MVIPSRQSTATWNRNISESLFSKSIYFSNFNYTIKEATFPNPATKVSRAQCNRKTFALAVPHWAYPLVPTAPATFLIPTTSTTNNATRASGRWPTCAAQSLSSNPTPCTTLTRPHSPNSTTSRTTLSLYTANANESHFFYWGLIKNPMNVV